MSSICPPDWDSCAKKCCFGDGVISHCDNPCYCRGTDIKFNSDTLECEEGEGYAPCIAVIDETTPGLSVQTADWFAFRAAWPTRPFYVLVPGSPGDVILPTGFDGSRFAVNRDNGDSASASDWFELCGLGSLASGQPVFLFIDNSGSMTTFTVQASANLFTSKCTARGLLVYSVTNSDERYIQPFISALVPT